MNKQIDYVLQSSATFFLFLLLFLPLGKSQTLCTGGFADSYPCSNVDLMSHLSVAQLGGGESLDCWGWTDETNGREYAIMGLNNGTCFVDISDPLNPFRIGNLPKHTSNSGWRDVKVNNNHAYIVSEAGGSGVQVFDLTHLRDYLTPPPNPIVFTEDAHLAIGNSSGNAHNIVINEETNFGYTVGTSSYASGGLVFYDLSNPINPILLPDNFGSDGYTHDAVCVIYKGPDTDYIGSEICIAFNEDTYTIVDVTDKTDPEQISKMPYTNSAYTHQGWISDDHKYLFINDELDEANNGHNTHTLVFDISNLDTTSYLFTHVGPTAAIDHNHYTKGSYLYQANYRAGMRILDISGVATTGTLSEEAFFDIYPNSNSANFNGAWNVYPYFKSGNVLISGIEQGLFVVRPNLPHYVMDLPLNGGVKEICQGEEAVFDINLTAYSAYATNVNLTLNNKPNNVTENFTTNDIAPNGSTSLVFSNSSNLAPGKYHMVIEGDGVDDLKQEIAIALIVNDAPTQTILSYPPNNETEISIHDHVSWNPAAGVNFYTFEIATDIDFNNIVETQTNLVAISYNPINLVENTQYFWRIISHENILTCTSTSEVFNFTTEIFILPIELISFNAKAKEQSILLDWSTATEVDNRGYELQRRSSNAYENEFEKIAWIESQGNSTDLQNYVFDDVNVKRGVDYFYQLKQIDFDGTTTYSPIVTSKLPILIPNFSVYPNPAKDHLNLQLQMPENLKYKDIGQITILDYSGRLLKEIEISIDELKNGKLFSTSDLQSGIYIIRLKIGNYDKPLRFVKL